MAEYSTVARPYAEALFAVASTDQVLGIEGWLEFTDYFMYIAAHPDVERVMTEPRISLAKRAEIFTSLLGNELPATAIAFIGLLFENNRLAILPQIAKQFAALKHDADGVAIAQITSAFELTEPQLHELISVLELKFDLQLKPRLTIDHSLIGGVRVAVGDQVLDMSVQAKLTHMRDWLAV